MLPFSIRPAAMSANRVNHEPVFLLSATPWRESSLWLEVFSRRYGRVALLARSARKRQSELRGVLVPFVPIDASWYGTGELKTLHRAEWIGGWKLPQGKALFSGMYVNELMNKITPREDAHPKLYDAMYEVMQTLSDETAYTAALRKFEWTLLTEMGLVPDLEHDENGLAVDDEIMYFVRPQFPVILLSQANALPAGSARGIAVQGKVLKQLAAGAFSDEETGKQALRITRLFLDFNIPEGIKSRQILQQLQRFHSGS